eukprot:s2917_g8.t1
MTLWTLSCGRKLPALDVHWQQAPGYLGKQSDDARAFVHFCFSAHSPMLNTSRLVRQLPRAMAPAAKRPAANVVAPEAKKPCVQEKGSEGAEVNPASLQDTLGCLRSGLKAEGTYAAQVAALQKAAGDLMNHWDLLIAEKRFRIAELEAYVHSPHHADPYAHGDEGQASCGVWYFHKKGGSYKSGSFKGMDLACGDKDGNVYAGLLLRSVADAAGKLTEGPCLVVDKILELNGKASIAAFADGRSAAELSALDTQGLKLERAEAPRTDPVRSSARVGLVLREEATKDAKGPKTHMQGRPVEFCARPYRFSTAAERLTKFRSGFVATAHLAGVAGADKLGLSDQNFSKYLKAADDGKSQDPSSWVNRKISTQPELCEFIGACHGDLLPSGMYVLPCFDYVLTWQGALFIKQGLYKGAVFKFRLVLPEEYPDQGPDLFFTSDVFHPMVDPKTGQVELGSLFPEWRPGRDFAAFALPHLHRAFLRREYFSSNARPALNQEAKQLFISDPAQFAERAKACANKSLLHVYDNASGSSLQFTKGPAEAHDAILEHLKADPSASIEERKTAFVDWFCDHYAHKRTRVGVAQGDAEAETILLDAKGGRVEGAGYPKAGTSASSSAKLAPNDRDQEEFF